MLKYVFLIFISMVLSLMAVTPQQLIHGGQFLYKAIVANDFVKQKHTLKSPDRLMLLKQAREVAKQNNDAQTTQYLTEQIIEQQNNGLTKKFIEALSVITVAGISWRLGWWWRLNSCANSHNSKSCYNIREFKRPWL